MTELEKQAEEYKKIVLTSNGVIHTITDGFSVILSEAERLVYEAYIKGNQDAKRWIPINEKMPEENVSVFGTDGKQILQGCIESNSNNVFCVGEFDILNDCTHWQPLPSTDSINLK